VAPVKKSMKNKILMQVEQLTRRYGETRAVDDLNFTLHRGQVLGLLGSDDGGRLLALSRVKSYRSENCRRGQASCSQ
jgi:ABC-2 type transport system ATP-binding protein